MGQPPFRMVFSNGSSSFSELQLLCWMTVSLSGVCFCAVNYVYVFMRACQCVCARVLSLEFCPENIGPRTNNFENTGARTNTFWKNWSPDQYFLKKSVLPWKCFCSVVSDNCFKQDEHTCCCWVPWEEQGKALLAHSPRIIKKNLNCQGKR